MCEAEVDDLDEPVSSHHDVVGLQVAVDDTRVVGFLEPFAELSGDMSHFRKLERSVLEALAERRPVDELHRDERRGLEISDLVDGNNVGMVERRGGSSFLLETLPPQSVGADVRAKDLDGGIAAESGVSRTVELPHPARAYLVVA